MEAKYLNPGEVSFDSENSLTALKTLSYIFGCRFQGYLSNICKTVILVQVSFLHPYLFHSEKCAKFLRNI